MIPEILSNGGTVIASDEGFSSDSEEYFERQYMVLKTFLNTFQPRPMDASPI